MSEQLVGTHSFLHAWQRVDRAIRVMTVVDAFKMSAAAVELESARKELEAIVVGAMRRDLEDLTDDLGGAK